MDPKIFKAYDIRGKYPMEINEKVTAEIVRQFGHYLKPGAKIVIGHDARLSSPNLYRAVIKQLKTQNSKLKTINTGLITTPMLYFLVNHFKVGAGIMITGSHNPKEYNGMKIVKKKAIPMSGREIYKIISKS